MADIFVNELLIYLVGQLGAPWVAGTNAFWGRTPESPVPSISLYEEPGEGADPIAAIFTPYITLKARAGGDDAIADARDIFDAAFQVLNRLAGINLTNFHLVLSQAVGSGPQPRRDEQSDVILEATFRIRYKEL